MIAEGAVNMSPMVSETMPLEDFERAIEMVRSRPVGFVKAIFRL